MYGYERYDNNTFNNLQLSFLKVTIKFDRFFHRSKRLAKKSQESHNSRITLSTAIFSTVVISLPMKVATLTHSMDDLMAFYVFNTRFESSASITQKGNIFRTK